MDLSPRARRTLSTILAVLLAAETVSAVAAAAATRPVTHALPADPPAGRVLAAEATVAPASGLRFDVSTTHVNGPRIAEPAERAEPAQAPAVATAKRTRTAHAAAATARAPLAALAKTAKAPKAAASTPRASSRGTARATPRSYSGSNHVWIPELGISRSVQAFACSRTRPPDNYMYRWGCAGSNNVYLMGHAASVMRPLHDAYVRGRLHTGLRAIYADRAGRIHVYAVRWWKLTRPTTDAAWAWAAQSVPSMTLQTCVGAHSEYRLMVRLVEVDG